jgi:Lsr2
VASKTIIEMVDDLDGTADGTVATQEFALNGVTYEIDLSETNRTRLEDLMEPFVAAGRRTGGRRRTPATGRAGTPGARSREETRAIREWAQRNGYEPSSRGRLSGEILEAYEAAQDERPRRSRAKANRS